MVMRKIMIAALLGLSFVVPVKDVRAEAFAKLSLDNIMKALVRYGAVDIRNDLVIDLYAGIMVCDLYQELYHDDFKWNKVRNVLREKIKEDIAFFPTGFQYDSVLQLGKYDFKEKIYRFSRKTAQFNANVFRMSTNKGDDCNRQGGLQLPPTFEIVLDKPVTIVGIPMDEAAGKKLFERLERNGNEDHLIYVRFKIGISYVAPFIKTKARAAMNANEDFRRGSEEEDYETDKIRFDGYLHLLEFYEDPERTHLIYREEYSSTP